MAVLRQRRDSQTTFGVQRLPPLPAHCLHSADTACGVAQALPHMCDHTMLCTWNPRHCTLCKGMWKNSLEAWRLAPYMELCTLLRLCICIWDSAHDTSHRRMKRSARNPVHHIHTSYIHIYIHKYIHTYSTVQYSTYIHTYIHTCIHTHIHAYMHTCIHAYIHTHMLTPFVWNVIPWNSLNSLEWKLHFYSLNSLEFSWILLKFLDEASIPEASWSEVEIWILKNTKHS